MIAFNNADRSGFDGNIATIALSASLLGVRVFSGCNYFGFKSLAHLTLSRKTALALGSAGRIEVVMIVLDCFCIRRRDGFSDAILVYPPRHPFQPFRISYTRLTPRLDRCLKVVSVSSY